MALIAINKEICYAVSQKLFMILDFFFSTDKK